MAAYRTAMAEFAQMRTMDIWYAHLDEEDIDAAIQSMAEAGKGRQERKRQGERGEKNIEKARTRDSLQALSKLAENRRRDPSHRQSAADRRPGARSGGDVRPLAGRRRVRGPRTVPGLPGDPAGGPADLLERFKVVDVARKVVGVGSVGTRAFIVLLQGRDDGDPLFLQVKEATASVLEDHLPKSRYTQHGERVVQGQRRMQAASDIFLGWTTGAGHVAVLLLAPAS